jgi:cobalt/nickel transport protein
MKLRNTILAAVAAIAMPITASAHFLLTYTGSAELGAPGEIPVKLIFWHPMDNGHVMDLAMPREFYMIHNGERTDLLDTLQPTTFQGAENTGAAFLGSVPIRRSGDYILVTVPEPYYEESEDIYIQQITRVFHNRNGLPTDWDGIMGLPAEIQPLNRPNNVLVGSTFTGRVLSNGEPVAGAEIEIEFMASEPDIAGAATTEPTITPPAGGTLVAISDANGYFTFGIPTAGWWGFAALGVGTETEFDGKELSQDAVIWIHATELE